MDGDACAVPLRRLAHPSTPTQTVIASKLRKKANRSDARSKAAVRSSRARGPVDSARRVPCSLFNRRPMVNRVRRPLPTSQAPNLEASRFALPALMFKTKSTLPSTSPPRAINRVFWDTPAFNTIGNPIAGIWGCLTGLGRHNDRCDKLPPKSREKMSVLPGGIAATPAEQRKYGSPFAG